MPETIPKQEKLARQIDGQVSVWADFAQSPRHPSAQQTRLADFIIHTCTPQDDGPEAVVSRQRFQQQTDQTMAASNISIEKRRAAIAELAQKDELDQKTIKDDLFRTWFEVAELYEAPEYHASPGYPLAVHYLKRLFIARERLPAPDNLPRIDGLATHEFGIVLRNLIEEL